MKETAAAPRPGDGRCRYRWGRRVPRGASHGLPCHAAIWLQAPALRVLAAFRELVNGCYQRCMCDVLLQRLHYPARDLDHPRKGPDRSPARARGPLLPLPARKTACRRNQKVCGGAREYVSVVSTRRTGVTMGFLRFKRRVWVELGPGGSHSELQNLYRRHRELCEKERAKRAVLSAAVDEARSALARAGPPPTESALMPEW